MKTLTLSIIALLALTGGVTAQSSDETRPPRPPREVVEQFDVDGDGRLNESERNALRDSGQGRRPSREQMRERSDTDGNGQLGQGEGDAARQGRGQRGQCRRGGRRGGGGGR